MTTPFMLTCYTRKPLEADVYSEKLAYSVHLTLSDNGSHFVALNDDSGVLFAKALEQEDSTLKAKSLVNPILFKDKAAYGVLVKRVEADGSGEASEGSVYLYYTTANFTEYELQAEFMFNVNEAITLLDCKYDESLQQYTIYWVDSHLVHYKCVVTNLSQLQDAKAEVSSIIEQKEDLQWIRSDIAQGNTIEITEEVALHLKRKLTDVYHISTSIPDKVEISSLEQLKSIKALLSYSDGSKAYRSVDWDISQIEIKHGVPQKVNGQIQQSYFKFPIAIHRADPNIFYYNEQFYYIATDDTTNGNLNFYVRAASTIAELEYAEEHLILNNDMYPELNKFLWAPEIHLINNKVYILFASSPHEFGEIRCHVMRLKDGGSILNRDDWEYPQIFLRQSGEELFTEGITLDMTYVQFDGGHYVIWAQRQLKPVDNGSWLYIATISPDKPWQLTSEPVVISKPEYGWSNNQTFVDEGPFAIGTDHKLFVTFSSALVNATYCVGVMSIENGQNAMDPLSWNKRQYPILTSRSIEGQFGPGHNSYVTDLDGTLLNVYHAKPNIDGPRSTGIRPVHFGFDGEPVLKMTEEQFLNEQLSTVSTYIIFDER